MIIFFLIKIMVTRLSIPKEQFPSLEKLVELPENAFSALADALRTTMPPLGRDKFVARLALKLPRFTPSEISELLNPILSIYRVKEKTKLDSGKIVDLIREAAPSGYASLFQGEKYELMKVRIGTLLSLDKTLGLGTKCVLGMQENERICYGAQIYSDLRPVFDDNQKAIAAAAINHVLKLHFGEDNDHLDFYITLDDDDLKSLKEEIEKAEHRSGELKAFLKQSEIFCLE